MKKECNQIQEFSVVNLQQLVESFLHDLLLQDRCFASATVRCLGAQFPCQQSIPCSAQLLQRSIIKPKAHKNSWTLYKLDQLNHTILIYMQSFFGNIILWNLRCLMCAQNMKKITSSNEAITVGSFPNGSTNSCNFDHRIF